MIRRDYSGMRRGADPDEDDTLMVRKRVCDVSNHEEARPPRLASCIFLRLAG